MCRIAIEHNCDRLYWHTQETNLTAQKLYDWIAQKPGIIEYRMPFELKVKHQKLECFGCLNFSTIRLITLSLIVEH